MERHQRDREFDRPNVETVPFATTVAQISALRKAIEVPPECISTDHVALAYTHVRLVLQLLRISVVR